jgi:hypothetical protein
MTFQEWMKDQGVNIEHVEPELLAAWEEAWAEGADFMLRDEDELPGESRYAHYEEPPDWDVVGGL